ncbi:MAG: sugar ABC transporter permease [Burkholderiales bacterium]|nr:sugar ABC transporter permease [Burkholderiales bacterium]
MSRTRAEALPFMLPAALLLAAVTAVPMLDVAWLSLEHRTPFRAPSFAGLDNYARLLADARFWNALWNTVYFAAVSVSLEIVLGLLVALAVVRAGRLRPVVYGAILVPWAIPGVVSARVWEWMYNPEIGLINHLLGSQVNWLGAPWVALHAAILMDVWKSTPFVALLLVAALQGIPRDLYRAAAVDGAGTWTTLRRITLPMLAPIVGVAAVFRTIDALRVFDAIYVLTSGGPANGTETLSIYAYKMLFQALDFGYGAALAVAMLLVTAAVTLVHARLLRRGDA